MMLPRKVLLCLRRCDKNDTGTCTGTAGTPVDPAAATVDVESAWNNPDNAAETWGENDSRRSVRNPTPAPSGRPRQSVMDDGYHRSYGACRCLFGLTSWTRRYWRLWTFVEDNEMTDGRQTKSLVTVISPAAAMILGLSMARMTTRGGTDGQLNTTAEDEDNADWAHVIFDDLAHVPSNNATMGGTLMKGELSQDFSMDERVGARNLQGCTLAPSCVTTSGTGCRIDYSGIGNDAGDTHRRPTWATSCLGPTELPGYSLRTRIGSPLACGSRFRTIPWASTSSAPTCTAVILSTANDLGGFARHGNL